MASDGTRPLTPNAAKTSADWSAAHSAITVYARAPASTAATETANTATAR